MKKFSQKHNKICQIFSVPDFIISCWVPWADDHDAYHYRRTNNTGKKKLHVKEIHFKTSGIYWEGSSWFLLLKGSTLELGLVEEGINSEPMLGSRAGH